MGLDSYARCENAGSTASLTRNGDDGDDSASLQFIAPVPEPYSDDNDDDDEDDCPPRANRNNDRTGDGYDDGDEKRPATWLSMPKKGQLAIMVLARLSEPLTQTSLQSYVFYQLRSFDPLLPDSTISAQAGTLQACYTLAQFFLSVLWGRLADSERVGRKKVLLIGLLGSAVTCVGFGFSRSFAVAVTFRILCGILNSNVGVMRAMIAEMIDDKRHQTRAFLLLPMCYNIGVIIGPIFGGMLADPAGTFPGLFGPGSVFGGKHGVQWMEKYPFALPNVLSGIFILFSTVAVFLGLDETHVIARYQNDWGRSLGRRLARVFSRSRASKHYRPLANDTDDETTFFDRNIEHASAPPSPVSTRAPKLPASRKRPSFGETWTPNVLLTLLTNFVLVIHMSAFNALTFVFLPTPRAPPGSHDGFLHFGGGLGFPSSKVGLATAIIGIIGLPLQIFVYPELQTRMGTLISFRTFLPFSFIAYTVMPFLVLLPAVPKIVWPAFTGVVAIQVISRTFSIPAGVILVNSSITNPAVLGTVHGVSQSIMSGARALGPFIGGWGLALGLQHNFIVGVWWFYAIVAFVGWLLLWTIHEGKGLQKQPNPEEDDN